MKPQENYKEENRIRKISTQHIPSQFHNTEQYSGATSDSVKQSPVRIRSKTVRKTSQCNRIDADQMIKINRLLVIH